MSNSSNASGGITFLGLLAILFITLKLAEIGVVAAWSWWWVLAPLWIPVSILVAILGVVYLIHHLAKK